MPLSVTEPIGRSIERTRTILFAPFDFVKWLKLGLCAFLAHLSTGGGSAFDWETDEPIETERSLEWLQDNWGMILTGALVVVPLIAAFMALVLWLEARGRFMFVDGVLRDRGAIREPWSEYRAEANSAFWFKFAITVAMLLLTIVILGAGLVFAWPQSEGGPFEFMSLVAAGVGLFVLFMATALVDLFLKDFVVPAMYARRIGVLEGWKVVQEEIFSAHPGEVFLYLVIKFFLFLVHAAIVVGLVCVTLCVAACFLAIPYVGTVILLPLFVFARCYSLYFLEQLGGEWRLFRSAPAE